MRAVSVLFRVVLGVVLAFAWGGCSKGKAPAVEAKGEMPTLRIGYLPITHSLPVVVAHKRDADWYRSFRLELVKFSSWPELVEAFSSGKIDGASELLVLALAGAERGIPEKILALSHRHGDILTVAKDINSVKDLKGKRVAIPHRMSVHNLILYRLLKENGMTLNDVEWIEMPPPDMPAALARGDLKAYIVAEPFGAKAVLGGYGKKLVNAKDVWPDYVCCGLVISPDFLTRHPDAAQEFVNSFAAAGRFIDANRHEAVKIAKEYMNIEEAAWKQSFEWGVSYGDLRPKRAELEALEKLALELKLLKSPVNVDNLVDDALIVQAYANAK